MSADKTIDERPTPRGRRAALRATNKQNSTTDTRAVTARGRSNAPLKSEDDEAPPERRGLVAGLRDYFEGVRTELRKVAWPTREDIRRLSTIVIVVLILASLALGAISTAFTELFRLGLSNPLILVVVMIVAVGVGVLINRRSSS